jgi:single-strand DNA-binding protein
MASFNRVILLGNLTRDVEVKYLQSGMAVAEVGLAVNDRRKDAKTNQWIEETTFVEVTFWGRTAEIVAEYLGKGSPVLVEGRLKLDQWETEGQKRSKLRVVCEKMQMIGSKGGAGAGGKQSSGGPPQYDESEFGGSQEDFAPRRTAGAQATSTAPPPDDEIPF